MIIEESGKAYTITECRDKWVIKNESGKLSVSFDIPKELCATIDELREYVLSNSNLFGVKL